MHHYSSLRSNSQYLKPKKAGRQKKSLSEMKELPVKQISDLLNSMCKDHDQPWLQYHVI